MIDETQTCTTCGVEKPLTEFYNDKRKVGGKRRYCKECCREYQRSDRFKAVRHKHWQTPEFKISSKRRRVCNKERIILKTAKKRAKKENWDFNLEITDVVIPDICPVFGIPLCRDNPRLLDNSPTLDRIDSNKGYVKGNVCVISNRANRVKGNSTIEDFLKIINYMLAHGQ
jgi:hypothetical protein